MPKPTYKSIPQLGAHLKEVRQEADLTQKQLADRLDVHRQSISRAEAGRSNLRKLILRSLEELGETIHGPFYQIDTDPHADEADGMSRKAVRRFIEEALSDYGRGYRYEVQADARSETGLYHHGQEEGRDEWDGSWTSIEKAKQNARKGDRIDVYVWPVNGDEYVAIAEIVVGQGVTIRSFE